MCVKSVSSAHGGGMLQKATKQKFRVINGGVEQHRIPEYLHSLTNKTDGAGENSDLDLQNGSVEGLPRL